MSNIVVNINRSVVQRYRAYGLSSEYLGSVLFILSALYEGEHEILDAYDDSNKERRVMLIYQHLHRKGFLEMQDNEDTIYTLTERGVAFVKFLKSFENGEKTHFTTIGEALSANEAEGGEISSEEKVDVSYWIDEWIKLFPAQKVDGRYLRTNKHECADRMRWFIKEYKFNKDVIFDATRLYLQTQEQSSDGHRFTRNCSYFIFKGRSKHDRTSDLATWCQRTLDGEQAQEVDYRDAV